MKATSDNVRQFSSQVQMYVLIQECVYTRMSQSCIKLFTLRDAKYFQKPFFVTLIENMLIFRQQPINQML